MPSFSVQEWLGDLAKGSIPKVDKKLPRNVTSLRAGGRGKGLLGLPEAVGVLAWVRQWH